MSNLIQGKLYQVKIKTLLGTRYFSYYKNIHVSYPMSLSENETTVVVMYIEPKWLDFASVLYKTEMLTMYTGDLVGIVSQ